MGNMSYSIVIQCNLNAALKLSTYSFWLCIWCLILMENAPRTQYSDFLKCCFDSI